MSQNISPFPPGSFLDVDQGGTGINLDGAASGLILLTNGAGGYTLSNPPPGTGDLLAVNNLSDVANAATSLSNIGGLATASLGAGVATFLSTPSSANLAAALTNETGSGSAVFATSPTLVTPILGTPTSGNLANCTFPTLNQNTSGTAAGLSATLVPVNGGTGVANNNASTWAISGNFATTVTVTAPTTVTLPISGTLATLADVETFTNKRITARVLSEAFSATPSINTDSYDGYHATAMSGAITSMTTNLTGSPNPDDIFIFCFLDNGSARAITWGAGFASSGNVALPTTTVISTELNVTCKRNITNTLWLCVGVA